MSKLKHVQLFENFNTNTKGMKAIVIKGESDAFVGAFPSEMADSLYEDLLSTDNQYYKIEILDVPPGCDIIMVPLFNGVDDDEESFPTTMEEYSMHNEKSPDVIRPGKRWDYTKDRDDSDAMLFELVNDAFLMYEGKTGMCELIPLNRMETYFPGFYS